MFYVFFFQQVTGFVLLEWMRLHYVYTLHFVYLLFAVGHPGDSMSWLSLPQQIWLVHESLFHATFDDLRVNVCKELDRLDILWMKTLYWLHSGWTQSHSYSGIWLFLPHPHPLLLAPSSTCVASCLLDDSHSDWSKPEFQFHSDLHFPDG